jgi:hypothetical protein
MHTGLLLRCLLFVVLVSSSLFHCTLGEIESTHMNRFVPPSDPRATRS